MATPTPKLLTEDELKALATYMGVRLALPNIKLKQALDRDNRSIVVETQSYPGHMTGPFKAIITEFQAYIRMYPYTEEPGNIGGSIHYEYKHVGCGGNGHDTFIRVRFRRTFDEKGEVEESVLEEL